MKKRSVKVFILAAAMGAVLPQLGCLSRAFFQQVLLEIAGEQVAAFIPSDFFGGGTTNGTGG